uniref:Phage-related tail fibre protein-like protein n=1 Tax=Geobacter sp. (strain M21) TaxID=443144 RepID=C6E6P3_GEOSM
MDFKTIWTSLGMTKRANAEILGTVVTITHMAFGDANGNDAFAPDQEMLALVHEVYRRPVDFVQVDEVNPAWVNVEGHILADDGGWWIREVGLFDADGDLVAVGNCAPRYKPLLAEGESADQYFKLILLTSNTAVITLKTNPAQAVASRKYVDDAMIEAGDGLPITLAVETTLGATHGTVFLNPAEGATVLFHLPLYGSVSGRKRYKLKNIGQGEALIDAADAKTLDGDATMPLVPGDRCEIAKDGANWQTI